MSSSSSVIKNFIYSLIYQVVKMILPLITIPYVSRKLGAESLGIYNYTYSVAIYFAMVGYLGFENYGNRLIAQNRHDKDKLDKAFTGAYIFQLFSGSAAIIAYAVYMIFFCRENTLIAWIQILYVGSEIFNISWLYWGLERFRKTAITNVVVRAAAFIAIILLVKDKTDLPVYTVICAATFLLSACLLWPGTRKHVSFCRVSFREVIGHGKGLLILFFPVLVLSIYRSMDKIMLGKMIDMVEVALYSNADKIVEVPFGVIMALGMVMIPRMTSMVSAGQKEQSFRYIEISMRFMLFLACGMCFGMMGIGKVFAPVYLGKEFIASGPLIMIIAPMIIVRACANVVRTQYLLPNKRDKDYIISILIGVVINLFFNALLIPHWHSVGASIATLMAESFVAFYQIFACRRDIPVVRYTFRNWMFLIIGALMFVPVYFIGECGTPSVRTLLLQIGTGFAVYMLIGGYCLLKAEKQLIKSLLGRKNRII